MTERTLLTRLIPLAFACGLASGGAQGDNAHLACYGCHGPGGVSAGSHIPTISGINFRYLYATLQDFRKDRREGTIMGRIAKGYRSGDLQLIALHFGTRPWHGVEQDVDATLASRGGELHVEYCEECHEDNGHFQDKDTPPLAGQATGYLRYQMHDYRMASGGMRQPAMMQERLEKLSDADLDALSAFYASLPSPDEAVSAHRKNTSDAD